MPDIRQIFVFGDIETGKFTDLSGTPLATASLPRLHKGCTVILCIEYRNADKTPAVLNSNDSYYLGGDINWNDPEGGESDNILKVNNNQFNIPGDWDEANPIAGKISVRITPNNPKCHEEIDGKAEILPYTSIKRTYNGIPQVITDHQLIIRNDPADNLPEPDPDDPLYRTANDQDSIDNLKANKVGSAIEDDIATLTSDGDLKDSGKKISDLVLRLINTPLTIPDTETGTINLGSKTLYRAFEIEGYSEVGSSRNYFKFRIEHDDTTATLVTLFNDNPIADLSYDVDISSDTVQFTITNNTGSEVKIIYKITRSYGVTS